MDIRRHSQESRQVSGSLGKSRPSTGLPTHGKFTYSAMQCCQVWNYESMLYFFQQNNFPYTDLCCLSYSHILYPYFDDIFSLTQRKKQYLHSRNFGLLGWIQGIFNGKSRALKYYKTEKYISKTKFQGKNSYSTSR